MKRKSVIIFLLLILLTFFIVNVFYDKDYADLIEEKFGVNIFSEESVFVGDVELSKYVIDKKLFLCDDDLGKMNVYVRDGIIIEGEATSILLSEFGEVISIEEKKGFSVEYLCGEETENPFLREVCNCDVDVMAGFVELGKPTGEMTHEFFYMDNYGNVLHTELVSLVDATSDLEANA